MRIKPEGQDTGCLSGIMRANRVYLVEMCLVRRTRVAATNNNEEEGGGRKANKTLHPGVTAVAGRGP